MLVSISLRYIPIRSVIYTYTRKSSSLLESSVGRKTFYLKLFFSNAFSSVAFPNPQEVYNPTIESENLDNETSIANNPIDNNASVVENITEIVVVTKAPDLKIETTAAQVFDYEEIEDDDSDAEGQNVDEEVGVTESLVNDSEESESRGFDGWSFIGGIFCSVSIMAICYLMYVRFFSPYQFARSTYNDF